MLLEVDHVSTDAVGSFLDGLRQGRVDVDAASDLIGGEIPVLRQDQLVEQLGGVGTWESANSPRFEGLDQAYLSLAMTETIVTGGLIEAATNKCTHDLKAKLDHAGIPADWNLRPTGTHSWGWWQDDLRGSWDTFARSFGLENENA